MADLVKKKRPGPAETYEPSKTSAGLPAHEPAKIINKPTEPPRKLDKRPGS